MYSPKATAIFVGGASLIHMWPVLLGRFTVKFSSSGTQLMHSETNEIRLSSERVTCKLPENQQLCATRSEANRISSFKFYVIGNVAYPIWKYVLLKTIAGSTEYAQNLI